MVLKGGRFVAPSAVTAQRRGTVISSDLLPSSGGGPRAQAGTLLADIARIKTAGFQRRAALVAAAPPWIKWPQPSLHSG